MPKAYPLKPDGTADLTSGIDVIAYTGDITDGGYYLNRHFRVPMQIEGGGVKQVAMLFKTSANQVLEVADVKGTGTDANPQFPGKRFVNDYQKDILSKLGISTEGGVTNLTLNGDIIPNSATIADINTWIDTLGNNIAALETVVGNSSSGLVKDVAALKAFFDGSNDVDQLINKWHELEEFLGSVTEADTLSGVITDALHGFRENAIDWTGAHEFYGPVLFEGDVIVNGSDNIVINSGSTEPVIIQLKSMGESTNTQTASLYYWGIENVSIDLPEESGVIALTHNIPFIGFSKPTTPKAGDFWISA